MKVALVILFSALAIVSAKHVAVDPHSDKHKGAAACGGAASKLSHGEKVEVVQAHNLFRSLEPATNMQKMVWDPKLASVAQSWADQCKWEHGMLTDCDNNKVGQNIYVDDARVGIPKLNLTAAVEYWSKTKSDYKWDERTCAPDSRCRFWTQLVWASSTKVGCGYSICPTLKVDGALMTDALLVICDYSPAGNRAPYVPPYQKGGACTNCDIRRTGEGYKCESNLCVPCSPATDASCKCSNTLPCYNGGVWSAKTCSCSCSKGFHGLFCEKTCSCADKLDICNQIKDPYCGLEDYRDFLQENCATTCGYPCNVPDSCKNKN